MANFCKASWGKAILFSGWLVLSATFVWALPQDEALKLPDGLSEVESRAIQKEQNPKSHVNAVIKVAEQRLRGAVKMAETGQFAQALQAVLLYESLYSYADSFARSLPDQAQKDRNKCLKQVEQAIFKQNRPLEAVRRDLPFNYREQTDPVVESLKRIRLSALNDVLGGGTFIKE